MLSEFQQGRLWDAWLSAEIRANYFAALSGRYQSRQRWLVLGSLILSSGATLALLTSVLPASYGWVKPLLTLSAAVFSAVSLVAKNERNAIDCADLHFRWNTLALDYENLWSRTYAGDAGAQFEALRRREAEVSKSSTSMPNDTRLLEKMQDGVVMQHQRELVA